MQLRTIMHNICFTIVSHSHVWKATALLKSFQRYDEYAHLYLILLGPSSIGDPNIKIIPIAEIMAIDHDAQNVVKKYANDPDSLRWSLKPVVIRYLLQSNPTSRVLYADSDMFFFGYPEHVYRTLDSGGIVLFPHWRPLHGQRDIAQFRMNYTDGLFNAGCIAANIKGLDAIEWWIKCCISACEINLNLGLWVDQKYLDLMIIYFPNTKICRHLGYNVADWNYYTRTDYLQEPQTDPEKFEIVLVHFTTNTMEFIKSGWDTMLKPYLQTYNQYLKIEEELRDL